MDNFETISCVFCLKSCETGSGTNDHKETQKRFLTALQRHSNGGRRGCNNGLLIARLEEVFTSNLDSCEDCLNIVNSFCELYHQMKCLELEVSWRVSKLSNVMTCADRVTRRVEEFHNNLRRGYGSIQMRLVEKFRKELATTCSSFLRQAYPQVLLKRCSSKIGVGGVPNKRARLITVPKVEVPSEFGNEAPQPVEDLEHTPLLEPRPVIKIEREEVNDTSLPDMMESSTFILRVPSEQVSESSNEGAEVLPLEETKPKPSENILSPLPALKEDLEQETEEIIAQPLNSGEDIKVGDLPKCEDVSWSNSEIPQFEPTINLPKCEENEPLKTENFDDDTDFGSTSDETSTDDDTTSTSSDEDITPPSWGTSKRTRNKIATLELDKMILQNGQTFLAYLLGTEEQVCEVDQCNDAFMTRRELELHSKLHDNFSCQFCDVSKSHAIKLALHELDNHVSPNTNDGAQRLVFKCARCPSSHNVIRGYLKHFMKEHLNLVWGILCPICDQVMSRGSTLNLRKSSLFNHYIQYHNNIFPGGRSVTLKCDVTDCTAFFVQGHQLDRHKAETHGLPLVRRCYSCGLEFRGSPELTKHVKEVCPFGEAFVKPFQFPCLYPRCYKWFQSESSVSRHLSLVHGDKCQEAGVSGGSQDKTCGDCGERFGSDELLVAHQKLHDAMPPTPARRPRLPKKGTKRTAPKLVRQDVSSLPKYSELRTKTKVKRSCCVGKCEGGGCFTQISKRKHTNSQKCSESVDVDNNESLPGKGLLPPPPPSLQQTSAEIRLLAMKAVNLKSGYTFLDHLLIEEEHQCLKVGCLERFETITEVELHSKLHGDFKCHFCEVTMRHAFQLALHELQHSPTDGVKKFTCPRCPFSAPRKFAYVVHHAKHHLKIEGRLGRKIKCPICDTTLLFLSSLTSRRQMLINHFASHHHISDSSPFQCGISNCLAFFSKRSQLNHHQRKIHATPSSGVEQVASCNCQLALAHLRQFRDPKRAQYKCEVEGCSERFMLEKELSNHSKLHGKFPCAFCPVTTTSAPKLAEHERRKHVTIRERKTRLGKLGKFHCARCPASFTVSKVYVHHHLKFHLGLEPTTVSCPVCRKRFYSTAELFRVLATHFRKVHGDDSNKQFVCENGSSPPAKPPPAKLPPAKPPPPQVAVKPHSKWNDKQRTDIDKVIFADGLSLCQYLQDEGPLDLSKEGPISCHICRKTFSRSHHHLKGEEGLRGYMIRHYSSHHDTFGLKLPEDIFRCDMDGCSAYFRRRSQLDSHKLQRHGEEAARKFREDWKKKCNLACQQQAAWNRLRNSVISLPMSSQQNHSHS